MRLRADADSAQTKTRARARDAVTVTRDSRAHARDGWLTGWANPHSVALPDSLAGIQQQRLSRRKRCS
jgi:hypothetical protein